MDPLFSPILLLITILVLMVGSSGITYLLVEKPTKKLPITITLDGAIGQLWELKKLQDPAIGSLLIVMDEKDVYVKKINEIKLEGEKSRATAKKLASFLLTFTWTEPKMLPLLPELVKAKAQIKNLQQKFDEEEKQLESKREKLLQLETNEEIKLLMSGS